MDGDPTYIYQSAWILPNWPYNDVLDQITDAYMTNSSIHDQLHRFLLEDADIRGEILSLNESYQKATEHQQLPQRAKNLLGEFLAAVRLIRDVFKTHGTLTLQIRGSGSIPLIMSEANEDGSIRGIVKLSDAEPTHFQPSASLAELVGDGVLSLTLDPIKGKRYQGIVPLDGSSLAEALTNYFNQSEQLPTRLWLFADDHHAGGLLLQALPAQQATHSEDAWETAEALADTLTHEELAELSHETMLMRLFNEFQTRLFPPSGVQFHCRCSRERCAQALLSIGREEAETLIAERDTIDMGCEFCGTQYTFGAGDLDDIFGGSTPVH